MPGAPGVGEAAPPLLLTTSAGAELDVVAAASDGSLGARGVLVVFLPYAFSPVCTAEVGDLRDRADDLGRAGLGVVAVTCDPLPALRAWAADERLRFPVLSDFWPHGRASTAWGVLQEATGAAGRSSFLLDRSGTVAWAVHNPPGRARSLQDALDAADALPWTTGPGMAHDLPTSAGGCDHAAHQGL